MKNPSGLIWALLLFFFLTPANVFAGDIMIRNAWIREMPEGAEVAAGYLEIMNHGTEPDRLVGAEAPGAMHSMLHEMTIDDNGVMRMRALENGIEIAPGETTILAPGGNHLMIMGVHEPYAAHSDIEITLTFERAGEITATFFVGEHARAGHDAAHGQDMNHNDGEMPNSGQMQHNNSHTMSPGQSANE